MKRFPKCVVAALCVWVSIPFASAAPPNIVWVIADDIGPEVLGCYGHPTLETPNLDALARDGVRFTKAFVTTSSCSPSRSSLFTGKFPHATGAENLHDPLPEDAEIVLGFLRAVGYWSANVGKLHLGNNAAKQFDVVNPRVNDWRKVLETRPEGKPFFFALGFVDAHRPFDRGAITPPFPPEKVVVPPYLADTPETREDLAAFYDEIRRLDQITGELVAYLREVGAYDNTLIIFMGDNGNPFPREKTTLYDSGIATPLIFLWSDRLKTPRVHPGLVSLVDIAPTVLEAVGVAVPAGMQGRSLLPLLAENASDASQYIFAEKNWHDFEDHSRAVRDARYKYIRNSHADRPLIPSADVINSPSWHALKAGHEAGTLNAQQEQIFADHRAPEELYDLDADPTEFNNLAADPDHADTLERLRGALDDWIARTHDVTTDRTRKDLFDAETGLRLEQ